MRRTIDSIDFGLDVGGEKKDKDLTRDTSLRECRVIF